jgi:transposase
MAALLIEARGAARDARQAGRTALDAGVLEDLVTRYQALATSGLAANTYRRTATAKDARRIARRFLNFEDMIPRFATRPDLDIFTNNEAERTIRPVKVQQRSSGLCCRVPFITHAFARWPGCGDVTQDRGEHRDRCGIFDPLG